MQVPLLQKVFVSRREEQCAGPLLHAGPLQLTNPALGVVSLQRANPLAARESEAFTLRLSATAT